MVGINLLRLFWYYNFLNDHFKSYIVWWTGKYTFIMVLMNALAFTLHHREHTSRPPSIYANEHRWKSWWKLNFPCADRSANIASGSFTLHRQLSSSFFLHILSLEQSWHVPTECIAFGVIVDRVNRALTDVGLDKTSKLFQVFSIRPSLKGMDQERFCLSGD